MQKFPHTLVKELASYVCLCIDIFAIFWQMFFLVIFIKNISPCLSSRYKQRANAIVTKSHAINIFFSCTLSSSFKMRENDILFTYNGPKTRISQLFTSLAGSQITQFIHFHIEIANSEQTNEKKIVHTVFRSGSSIQLFFLHELLQHV